MQDTNVIVEDTEITASWSIKTFKIEGTYTMNSNEGSILITSINPPDATDLVIPCVLRGYNTTNVNSPQLTLVTNFKVSDCMGTAKKLLGAYTDPNRSNMELQYNGRELITLTGNVTNKAFSCQY